MKRYFKLFLLLSAAFLCSCNPMKELRIGSVSVESLRPSGLEGATAIVAVGINNPLGTLYVSDFKADIDRRGQHLFRISAEDFTLAAHCDSVYRLTVDAFIDSDITLFSLVRLLDSPAADGFPVTISAKVGVSPRVGKVVVYKTHLEELWKKSQ